MKKRSYLIIALVLMMSFVLASCGGGGGAGAGTVETTLEDEYYNVTVSVPENEEGEAAYTFAESSDGYVLETDKLNIYFEQTYYSYVTSLYFVEEHGDGVEPSFEGYKDFMINDPYDMVFGEFTETTFAGREAVGQYSSFDNTYFVTPNTDDITEYPTDIRITAVNDEDNVEDLMADETIKAMLDSIVFAAK